MLADMQQPASSSHGGTLARASASACRQRRGQIEAISNSGAGEGIDSGLQADIAESAILQLLIGIGQAIEAFMAMATMAHGFDEAKARGQREMLISRGPTGVPLARVTGIGLRHAGQRHGVAAAPPA